MYNLTSKDKPPPTLGVIIRYYMKRVSPLTWTVAIILVTLLYLLYSHYSTYPPDVSQSDVGRGDAKNQDVIGPNLAVKDYPALQNGEEGDTRLEGNIEEFEEGVGGNRQPGGHRNMDAPDIGDHPGNVEHVVKLGNGEVKELAAEGRENEFFDQLKNAIDVNKGGMVHNEQKKLYNVHNHDLDEVDEDYIIAKQHNRDPNVLPVLPRFDPNRHIHGALPDKEVFYPSPKVFPVATILSPKVENCPQDEQFLLIIVISMANQTKHRNSIRRTWGKPSNFKDIAHRSKMAWWVVFSIGTTDGTHEIVREEEQTHGDIIQGDFFDHPSEETRKTMQGLKWAAEHLPASCRPLFILKTECSVFVNTPLLTKWIGENFSQSLSTYTGKLIRDDVPIRDLRSSLYVPEHDYIRSVFPSFIQGPSYLLSMDVTTAMASMFRQVTPIAMEDAYIGLLAEKMQIVPKNVDKFQVTERPQNVCHYLEMVFIRTGKATVHHQIFMVVNHQEDKCTGPKDL